MNDYKITFAQSARKELEKPDNVVVNRIISKIEQLSKNPRPFGCRKLKGFENLWRIRVGDYRVVYRIFDDEQIVDVVVVRHRKQIYGFMKRGDG